MSRIHYLNFNENLSICRQCIDDIDTELKAIPNIEHIDWRVKEQWAKITELLLQASELLGEAVIE